MLVNPVTSLLCTHVSANADIEGIKWCPQNKAVLESPVET